MINTILYDVASILRTCDITYDTIQSNLPDEERNVPVHNNMDWYRNTLEISYWYNAFPSIAW